MRVELQAWAAYFGSELQGITAATKLEYTFICFRCIAAESLRQPML